MVVGGKRSCPVCRTPANFVLKSTFDDPVFRFYDPRTRESSFRIRNSVQVAGFISFKRGLIGESDPNTYNPEKPETTNFNLFDPLCGEDRWGDMEGGQNRN